VVFVKIKNPTLPHHFWGKKTVLPHQKVKKCGDISWKVNENTGKKIEKKRIEKYE